VRLSRCSISEHIHALDEEHKIPLMNGRETDKPSLGRTDRSVKKLGYIQLAAINFPVAPVGIIQRHHVHRHGGALHPAQYRRACGRSAVDIDSLILFVSNPKV
jgi:hypothetical protein